MDMAQFLALLFSFVCFMADAFNVEVRGLKLFSLGCALFVLSYLV